MVKQRIIDVLESKDRETKLWKTSFLAARMAYEEGKLREAKSLIVKSWHRTTKISNSHDRTFAEATTLLGHGAILLAEGNLKDARKKIEEAMNRAHTLKDNAFQEIYAITLRFYADCLIEEEEFKRGEELLLESIKILEDTGVDGALFLADSLSDLCSLYLIQGRYSEIEDYITTAVSIYRSVKGAEDIDYYRSASINRLVIEKSNGEEMENIIENTLTRSAYLVSLQHPHMQKFLKRYCHYLTEKGDFEKIDILHNEFKGAFVK